jgi:hypothetical protein
MVIIKLATQKVMTSQHEYFLLFTSVAPHGCKTSNYKVYTCMHKTACNCLVKYYILIALCIVPYSVCHVQYDKGQKGKGR